MNLLLILIVGGLIGWIASKIMRTDAQQGIILNVVVGVVGALIAGFFLGGGASILNAPFNLMTILWSLVGAIVLLAIVNLIRRGSVR